MTAIAGNDEFEVIVTRGRSDPARLHYQIARVRSPQEDGDHLELLGDLTTPACPQAVARELAVTWLRLTGRASADSPLRFVWGVVEPGAEPARTVGGVVRYGTVRRARLFGRGRS